LLDVQEAFAMTSVSTRAVELFKDDVTMRCVAFGDGNTGFVGEKNKGIVHAFDVSPPKGKKKLTPIVQSYVVQNGGKKTSVNSLKLNADYSRLFAGVSKPTVRVHCFDVSSGQELCTYPQHVDSIFAISVNSSCVMSGGGQTDKNLIVSDLESQTKLISHPHKGSVRGLDSTENLILSGSLDGYVRLFDLRSGKCEKIKKVKKKKNVSFFFFCVYFRISVSSFLPLVMGCRFCGKIWIALCAPLAEAIIACTWE
jgi:WD40 repeat protein